MRVDSGRYVPVLMDFSEAQARKTSWGRLLELSATGARLLTRAALRPGDSLSLRFDLLQEVFEGLEAEVARAAPDMDGYTVAELRFPDPEARRRLGRTLSRLLL